MREILNKNIYMKRIEEQRGEKVEEVLRKLFVDENKPIETIANELHISYATVIRWLRLANITSRMLKL